MKLGASSHRAEHDWFFDGGRSFDSDVNDPKYASLLWAGADSAILKAPTMRLEQGLHLRLRAFREDWLARTSEIVEKYHPDLLYFDWWVGQPDFRETERKFAAFYYDYAAQHGNPS
jgi:alpha-L-fucosidase